VRCGWSVQERGEWQTSGAGFVATAADLIGAQSSRVLAPPTSEASRPLLLLLCKELGRLTGSLEHKPFSHKPQACVEGHEAQTLKFVKIFFVLS